ncbi:MAG: hypothetical protein ACSLFD_00175 [Solirubrobacterales bacterium]
MREVIDKRKVSKKVSDCAQKELVGLLAISALIASAVRNCS